MTTSQDRSNVSRYEQQILDTSSIGVLITRISDGTILYANRVISDLMGVADINSIIGMPVPDFYWDPNDRLELLERFRAEGSITNSETRARRADGSMIWVSIALQPFEFEGEQVLLSEITNITEQKRTENTIKKSQQRLALLIDSSPLAVIEWNTNFEVASWNPAAERIFGYTAAEAQGKHARFIIPTEFHMYVDQVWEGLITQTGGTRATNANVTKDGQTITCEWYNTPLVGTDGKVLGASSLVEDITERKQTEDAVKESQQKLALLIDSSPLAFIEWNTNFEVVSWNPAAERIFGYTAAEAQGKHARFIIPPEFHMYVDQVWEGLITQTGGTRATNANITKDGRTITSEWYNSPLSGPDGKVFGVSSLVEDITERKESEKKLLQMQSAVEQTGDGIAMADLGGNVLYANPAWARMHGYTLEEILGKHLSIFHTPEQLEKEVVPFNSKVMSDGISTSEIGHARKDGSIFPTLMTTVVQKDENDNPVGLIGTIRDITERKLLEREALEAFERRGYQVQVSTEISQEIAGATELSDLFERVVSLTKERFGYYHTQLLRYDHAQDAVVLVAGYGETGKKMLSDGHQMPLGSGLIGTAAATGQTIIRPTLTEDPDWQPNPLLPDTKGEIAVPIKLGDQILGVLDVQSDLAGALSEDDRLLLEGLCGQIAVAIEQTRLRQEMAERLEEVNRLYQSMSHEGWKSYRDTTDLPEGFVFDQTGTRSVDAEVSVDEHFANIPMKVPGGEVVGMLTIANDPRNPASAEEQAFLQQVSDQIALALENARLAAQTQSALAQTEKLSEAGLRFARSADLQELLIVVNESLGIPAINRTLLGIFNYDVANELSSMDIVANWWTGEGHAPTEIGRHYSLETLSVLPMFMSTTPVFFNDTFHDERINAQTLELFTRQNIRSLAVLPLFLGSRQIGALFLESEETHEFTQDQIRLFSAMAPQIATVLENRRQFERAQKQADRETMLNVISQKIQSATTVDAVLQIAARELGHALGAPMTIAQLSMKDKEK